MDRRNTRQRKLILDAVKSRCDHPSAEQIYEQVKKVDPSISLGTVYRNLAILTEEGQIFDVKLPEADRFDLKTELHYHFVCEHCKKVFDIDVPYDDSLNGFRSEKGFLVHSHHTIFTGLCPNCAKLIKTEDVK